MNYRHASDMVNLHPDTSQQERKAETMGLFLLK